MHDGYIYTVSIQYKFAPAAEIQVQTS